MYRLQRIFNFKVHHEAVCQTTCPEFAHLHEFQVTLEFEADYLFDKQTLCSDENLESFEQLLIAAQTLPDVWSVESLAEQLFEEAAKFYPNLKTVSCFSTDQPYKVGIYTKEFRKIESNAIEDLLIRDVSEIIG